MSKKRTETADTEIGFSIVSDSKRVSASGRKRYKWDKIADAISSGKTVSVPIPPGRIVEHTRRYSYASLRTLIGSTHVIHTSVDKQENAVIVWAEPQP